MTFAWQGPSQLSYVGEYRCTIADDEDLPTCGLLLSGWLERDAPRLLRNWYIRLVGEDRFVVGTTADIDSFLARCDVDGLSCWCSGILLPSPIKCFVPLSIDVYKDCQSPGTVSRFVAEKLYLNSTNRFLKGLFCLPRPVQLSISSLHPSLCHPYAYLQIQTQLDEIVSLAANISGALLFLLHHGSTARSKSSSFYGVDASRLGNSAYVISRTSEGTRVSRDVSPAPLPHQPLRGCLVVGQTGALLFKLLTELMRVSPAGHTLIVCRKEEYPFLKKALETSGEPHAAIVRLSDFRRVREDASIVVLSVECLYHEDSEDLSAGLRARRWDRLICLGWPDLQDELQSIDFHVAYESKISLCLAEEIDLSVMDLRTVEEMLGLFPFSVQDLSLGYFEVLKRQIYFLRCPATEHGWVAAGGRGYDLLRAPAVSPLEEMSFEGLRAEKKMMRALFGDLCCGSSSLGSQFPSLSAGDTFETHFRRLQVPLTSFAQEQLLEPPTEEHECPVCFEPGPEVATSCGHFFCKPCIQSSLRVQRKCPSCRTILRRRDLVTGAAAQDSLGEYLSFLFQHLTEARHRRLAVLASWPENHERLTAWFRRRGLSRCWAWRGSAERLESISKDFYQKDEPGGCLFVDPDALSWETFPGVSEALVLWPLNLGRACVEGCCQIRKAGTAFPDCKFSLLLRGDGEGPPTLGVSCCKKHALTLPCRPFSAGER